MRGSFAELGPEQYRVINPRTLAKRQHLGAAL
jgi:hypothetical protein